MSFVNACVRHDSLSYVLQKHSSVATNAHSKLAQSCKAAIMQHIQALQHNKPSTTASSKCIEPSSQLVTITAGQAASLQLSILLSLAHTHVCTHKYVLSRLIDHWSCEIDTMRQSRL
jgi:hypothetical protein